MNTRFKKYYENRKAEYARLASMTLTKRSLIRRRDALKGYLEANQERYRTCKDFMLTIEDNINLNKRSHHDI